MVTKSQRTKTAERIERAKRKYKVAEDVTDSVLLRLAASRWTLGIIIGVVAAVLIVWAL